MKCKRTDAADLDSADEHLLNVDQKVEIEEKLSDKTIAVQASELDDKDFVSVKPAVATTMTSDVLQTAPHFFRIQATNGTHFMSPSFCLN